MSNNVNAKKINWQPEHFPIGTVVVLDGISRRTVDDPRYSEGIFYFSSKDPGAIVTVTNVVQNGLDSFLIDTGEVNKNLKINYKYNFDHIASIIKRGEGPVKVERYRGYGKPECPNAVISDNLINTNQYHFRSDFEIVQYLISLTTLPKNLYLKEGFFDFLVKQSFVKKTEDKGWRGCFLYSVDKKRARRFIQQNINRWIKPMKEVRAEVAREAKLEVERYYQEMGEDFDATYDREYGFTPHTVVDQNAIVDSGSSFD